ncbi:MAG: ABC transporter permease [Nocardioidaceae bacterium]
MFLALRDLRFARGRFALMGAVIGLLSMLIVLLSGLTSGLSHQSVSAITSLPADHIAFSEPAGGQDASYSDSHVTAKQQRTWSTQPGVDGVATLGIMPSQVKVGHSQTAVTMFASAPGSMVSPPGVSQTDVVISRDLADAQSLHEGDRLSLGGTTYDVGGVRGDSYFNHTPVVWVSLHQLQGMQDSARPLSTVLAIRAGDDADLAAADAAAGTHTASRDDSLSAVGSYTAENGSLTLMRVLLLVVGALVVGAFFTVWTIQRMPDLAVLKAIGASGGYLVRDALAQALVVLAVGGILGAAVAAGIGVLAAGVVPFVVSAATVVVPLVAIVVLGMAGAVTAVRRVTTVDPLTALGAAR